jgi:radical SAM protein with 4Fe4S-binding SPASM domain
MNDLKNSKNFCSAPWMHLHVINDGRAFPCCMTPLEDENSFGNVKEQSLIEVLNSDNAKKMRRDMISNKPLPKSCERCYGRESHGLTSQRQGMNDNWFNKIKHNVERTNIDGSIDELNLRYWDFRFSNYCNLSCRTCGPLFSSAWSTDYPKLHIDDQKVGVIHLDNADVFWRDIEKNIMNMEEIMFAGGEPMIMNEHWKMIELFEKYEHYNVELKYSTNATLLHRGKKNILDIWKKFRHVHLSLSIDGVGDSFNYIRNGGNWNQVEKNLLHINENDIDFWIHPTVSNLNIFRLPELHKKLFDLGLIPLEIKKNEKYYNPDDYFIKRFHINPLYVQEFNCVKTLPNELKEMASDKIKKYGDEMNNNHGIPTNGWDSIINFMWESDESNIFDQFVNMTNKLDLIRKQNILSINPEYKNYFK